MNSLVSVIIPVYKVEKYIEKCMQSLLDQTYTNFEALIVDDGSPDDSIKLAKALVGDDPRFIFFEKENGGQGTARNLALDHAKGEYVAFLDSDDTYTPEMLKTVVAELDENESVDILSLGVNYVDESGDFLFEKTASEEFINTNKDVLLLNKTATNFFCDKVFRFDIISGFRFSSVIKTYEDVDLLYQVLYGCNIKRISVCLYNYTQREGSTTNSLPPSFIKDRCSILVNAKLFLVNKGIFNVNKEYYLAYYVSEVFYKSLIKIAAYSCDYIRDVNDLLDRSDVDFFNFKSFFAIKPYYGLKATLMLSVFKINKYLFKSIVKALMVIKGKN